MNELRDRFADQVGGESERRRQGEPESPPGAEGAGRAEAERWQAVRRCVKRVLDGTPVPAGLAARVRSRLYRPPARWWPRLAALGLPGLGLAAGVALALVFWPAGAVASVEAGGLAAVFRRCAVERRHDAYGLRAVLPAEALQQLRQRAALAGGVPDVTACGFHVDGACNCGPGGPGSALHVYFRCDQSDRRVVSVFVLERPLRLCSRGCACAGCAPGGRSYRQAVDGDVTVLSWNEGGRGYAVCARMGAEELAGLLERAGTATAESGTCRARALVRVPQR